MEVEEAYVLDEGKYHINVSRNVHDTVESLTFELEDKIVYTTAKTGQEYKNYFDYANGGLTYLSRSDWEGTYPTSDDISTHADDELYDTFDAYWHPERNKMTGDMPTLEADNGIMLTELKGLDFDDPLWSAYLDQFTYEELIDFYSTGGWQTLAIERLGIPQGVLLDGPAGINYFFGDMTSAAYPAALLLASTWNDDLVYEMGVSLGTEARAYGVHALYAPAMNIHRTAYGGRNFEYYSEDPLIAGRMGAAIIKGVQSKDVAVTMKHFIANDQEINARSGLFTWMNEQALREIYLEPFAIALEDNDVSGVMSSFIHLGHKWSGANTELLNDVLRGELGFTGFVETDAVQGGFMKPNLSLRGGSDLMLAPIPTLTANIVDDSYDLDPVGTVTGLRDRVHTTLHTMLNKTRFAD
jgi:beta-glucosidase